MNPWTRLLRTLGAAAVAVSFVMAGGSGNMARGDSPGDIYVANGQVLDEVLTSSQSIQNPLSGVGNPALLAFSPGGERLYVANGTATVTVIDVKGNTVRGTYPAPGKVVAMAYPAGQYLYVAVEGARKLSVLSFTGTAFADGPVFKDAPDLLAASPLAPDLAVAKKGAGWISIYHQSDGKQTQVSSGSNIGGAIVELAVARGEGYLWIATSGTARVSEAELSTGNIKYTAPLSSAPVALAAMPHMAVVAAGKSLYKVAGNAATAWATASAPLTALAVDQSGSVLYAATADTVLAYTAKHPSGPVARIAIGAGTTMALAPVPNIDSSVAPASGGSTSSSGPGASGNGTTSGTAKPRKTHAPATDTISDIVGAGRAADLTTALLMGGALVVGVAMASRYLIKRLIKA